MMQMWTKMWTTLGIHYILPISIKYLSQINGGDEGIRTLETLPGLLP